MKSNLFRNPPGPVLEGVAITFGEIYVGRKEFKTLFYCGEGHPQPNLRRGGGVGGFERLPPARAVLRAVCLFDFAFFAFAARAVAQMCQTPQIGALEGKDGRASYQGDLHLLILPDSAFRVFFPSVMSKLQSRIDKLIAHLWYRAEASRIELLSKSFERMKSGHYRTSET